MRAQIIFSGFGYGALYLAAYLGLDGTMVRIPGFLALVLAAALIWISIEDHRHQSFPLLALAGLAVVCILLVIWLGASPVRHLLAALIYGACLIGLSAGMQHLMDRVALGLGDIGLILCAAILLGPLATIQVILLASVAALVWLGLRRILLGTSPRAALAFGPFLCLAIWITFLEPGLMF
ncbi:MAG: A24 family peptidase [Silicimonas sp.]|nr:A24 family peptidase [Silicimonas sp.]